MNLLDKYLPEYDVSRKHEIWIDAKPETVFPLIESLDFSDSKIIYWLFKVRGMPVPESLSLEGIEKLNFVRLETEPGREIVLGLIGQFWTPSGNLIKFKREEFTLKNTSTHARAIWNFVLTPGPDGGCAVCTETRVLCPDKRTRRRFLLYWKFIGPFSSWTRKEILKALKRKAECNGRH